MGEIEIKNVPGPVLQLIVDYLQHHNGKLPTKEPAEDSWDAHFINQDWRAIGFPGLAVSEHLKTIAFQIVQAANFMGIRSLLNLGVAKIKTWESTSAPRAANFM